MSGSEAFAKGAILKDGHFFALGPGKVMITQKRPVQALRMAGIARSLSGRCNWAEEDRAFKALEVDPFDVNQTDGGAIQYALDHLRRSGYEFRQDRCSSDGVPFGIQEAFADGSHILKFKINVQVGNKRQPFQWKRSTWPKQYLLPFAERVADRRGRGPLFEQVVAEAIEAYDTAVLARGCFTGLVHQALGSYMILKDMPEYLGAEWGKYLYDVCMDILTNNFKVDIGDADVERRLDLIYNGGLPGLWAAMAAENEAKVLRATPRLLAQVAAFEDENQFNKRQRLPAELPADVLATLTARAGAMLDEVKKIISKNEKSFVIGQGELIVAAALIIADLKKPGILDRRLLNADWEVSVSPAGGHMANIEDASMPALALNIGFQPADGAAVDLINADLLQVLLLRAPSLAHLLQPLAPLLQQTVGEREQTPTQEAVDEQINLKGNTFVQRVVAQLLDLVGVGGDAATLGAEPAVPPHVRFMRGASEMMDALVAAAPEPPPGCAPKLVLSKVHGTGNAEHRFGLEVELKTALASGVEASAFRSRQDYAVVSSGGIYKIAGKALGVGVSQEVWTELEEPGARQLHIGSGDSSDSSRQIKLIMAGVRANQQANAGFCGLAKRVKALLRVFERQLLAAAAAEPDTLKGALKREKLTHVARGVAGVAALVDEALA